MVLFLESNGKLLALFSGRYVLIQLAVVWAFLLAAIVSPDFEAGMFLVLSYFVTFVLNFLIVNYLFQRGFREAFSAVLCAMALLAAFVGIREGLFRSYLPFYRDAFLSFDYDRMLFAMTRSDFRALGTLGNPIVYSVALSLSLPFAFEIKRWYARYLVVGLLLLASFFSVSTTAVLVWIILGVGVFLNSKAKARLILLIVTVMIALVIRGQKWNYIGYVPLDRLIFGDPENIQVRMSAAIGLLDCFWSDLTPVKFLFGYGLKSSISAVEALGPGSMNTPDNTYLALLFETGTFGLMTFLTLALNLLWGFRRARLNSLHWYSVLSWFIVGVTFVTVYYATFNFIWVASVAALVHDKVCRRDRIISQ